MPAAVRAVSRAGGPAIRAHRRRRRETVRSGAAAFRETF
jgi:hypothetical protein